MSDARGSGLGPRPVTTKVGGGISPRVATAVAAAVLGAVVWIGVAGRTTPPDISRASSAPAASRTPSETAAATPSAVAGAPTATPMRGPFLTAPPESLEPILGRIVFGRDKYSVMATVDGRLYLEVLDEFEPGRFRGSFRIPFPSDPANRYEIKLAQLWSRDKRRGTYVEIGSWPLYLTPLQEATQVSGPVLQTGLAAQPELRGVPRAVRRGFTMTVRAESRVIFGIVRIEIEFGPRPER